MWQRHGCVVLPVIHDVEEAVLLADRVLVMKGGVIAHEERIAMRRPRDVADQAFARIRGGLLNWFGVRHGKDHDQALRTNAGAFASP
ncbi:hypothetical protein [Phyllobacterium brassicacearum]|uniref:hypothetical protein n=1 Tax=Phyllobacterium brassicacearum TaxID=314235 RepID=UPI0010E7CD11|nr:hypothetical protein [Phyllobacterium brassicacearum]TDQ17719.1 hypothetical protein DEV91_12811 [Phyllobacterium brassicacearum]